MCLHVHYMTLTLREELRGGTRKWKYGSMNSER